MKSVSSSSSSSSSSDQPQMKVLRRSANEFQSIQVGSLYAKLRCNPAHFRTREAGNRGWYGVIGLGEPTIAGGLTGCWLRWHIFSATSKRLLVPARPVGIPVLSLKTCRTRASEKSPY